MELAAASPGWSAAAPVFLGAMVGYNVNSEPLELAFYGVAGGAILYVIGEVWNAMRRYGYKELGLVAAVRRLRGRAPDGHVRRVRRRIRGNANADALARATLRALDADLLARAR